MSCPHNIANFLKTASRPLSRAQQSGDPEVRTYAANCWPLDIIDASANDHACSFEMMLKNTSERYVHHLDCRSLLDFMLAHLH